MASLFNANMTLNGVNTQAWPTTGANMIVVGFSRVSGTKSDTLYCYLNVTGSNTTDKMDCQDAYLKNVTDNTWPNIMRDAQDDLLINVVAFQVRYYTNGTNRFLDWTVSMTRGFDTLET